MTNTSDYRTDLADKLPETHSLPACFEACAKIVTLSSDEVDDKRATGPGSATTTAQQELESLEKDRVDLDSWLSFLKTITTKLLK